MHALLALLLLMVLIPSVALAQTTNSRTMDGTGRPIDSATSTPVGTERALVVRPIPGATQPVSVSSLPLPTNAATLQATQDIEAAIREAQGIGPTTSPFMVKGTGAVIEESIAVRCVNAANNAFVDCAGTGGSGVAQGSTTSGQTGSLTLGAVTTAAPSYTTAQTSPLSLTTAGGLRIDTSSIAGTTTSTGNGVVGAGVQRVAIASDNSAFSVNGNIASIAGTTTATGNGVVSAGVQRVAIASDNTPFSTNSVQSGTWTVQPGNTANTTPWLVTQVPTTSGGGSTCYLTSAASTNSTNCKASVGQVYHISAINTTGTLYYLRMYNLASAPTCSSATGFVETVPVPASTTGSGFQRGMVSGQAYSTGIGFCLTGGGSSTDNTNAATGVYLSVIYK